MLQEMQHVYTVRNVKTKGPIDNNLPLDNTRFIGDTHRGPTQGLTDAWNTVIEILNCTQYFSIPAQLRAQNRVLNQYYTES